MGEAKKTYYKGVFTIPTTSPLRDDSLSGLFFRPARQGKSGVSVCMGIRRGGDTFNSWRRGRSFQPGSRMLFAVKFSQALQALQETMPSVDPFLWAVHRLFSMIHRLSSMCCLRRAVHSLSSMIYRFFFMIHRFFSICLQALQEPFLQG